MSHAPSSLSPPPCDDELTAVQTEPGLAPNSTHNHTTTPNTESTTHVPTREPASSPTPSTPDHTPSPNFTHPETYISAVEDTLRSLQSQIQATLDAGTSQGCPYGNTIYDICRLDQGVGVEPDRRLGCAAVNRSISSVYLRQNLATFIRLSNYSISNLVSLYKVFGQFHAAVH